MEICLCSKIESFIAQQAVKRNTQGRTCVYACIARPRGSPHVISIHIFLTETQSYHMPKWGENGELCAWEEGGEWVCGLAACALGRQADQDGLWEDSSPGEVDRAEGWCSLCG